MPASGLEQVGSDIAYKEQVVVVLPRHELLGPFEGVDRILAIRMM